MDREKIIKALEICEKKDCVLCPYTDWCGEYEDSYYDCTKLLAKDVLAMLKEQKHLLTEYEKLSKVLFKIEKYFKISDLSSLVDGIENGNIIVLQDNGHFIGETPFTETTIKIRRL